MSDQAMIFERYGQLATTKDSAANGYGLGLAVCKRLADLMNGVVGVDSSPGYGARFFLRLQIVQSEKHGYRISAGVNERSKVLLIEDSDYSAWAIRAVLKRAKIGMLTRVKSGSQAIQMLKRQDFALILVDGHLPDCEGADLCQANSRD